MAESGAVVRRLPANRTHCPTTDGAERARPRAQQRETAKRPWKTGMVNTGDFRNQIIPEKG